MHAPTDKAKAKAKEVDKRDTPSRRRRIHNAESSDNYVVTSPNSPTFQTSIALQQPRCTTNTSNLPPITYKLPTKTATQTP